MVRTWGVHYPLGTWMDFPVNACGVRTFHAVGGALASGAEAAVEVTVVVLLVAVVVEVAAVLIV